jgi:biotin transporter BioY
MFARLGFVARGIVYIVIGAIALMVAFGVARHEPDRAGAIEAIAAKPCGYLLLWILVIGFLGMAVRRFVQAAVRRLN